MLAILVNFSLVLLTPNAISASSQNLDGWLISSPTIDVSHDSVSDDYCRGRETITVVEDSMLYHTSQYLACVTKGDGIEFATYRDSTNNARRAVKTGNDDYRIVEFPDVISQAPRLVPMTKTLAMGDNTNTPYGIFSNLSVLTNFDTHLVPLLTSVDGRIIKYRLDTNSIRILFPYLYGDQNRYTTVSSYTFSSNGRYMLAKLYDSAFAVVDFSTGQEKIVARIPGAWYDGQRATAAGAISDDGTIVYISGAERFYSTKNCGDPIEYINDLKYPEMVATCSFRENSNTLNEVFGGSGVVSSNMQFDYDGGILRFVSNPIHYAYVPDKPRSFASMTMPGFRIPKLDYFAMGDSFASGEGDIDIEGIGRYLPGTNILGDYENGIPRETCHLSERSYPFLLGIHAGLSRRSGMDSVACSGAVRGNIFGSTGNEFIDGKYKGQLTSMGSGEAFPRLKGIANADDLQQEARDTLLPGRVQQIEQLREQQPLAATIQISGNDLKFGPIITACLFNNLGETGTKLFGANKKDCDWVKPEFRANVASQIESNHAALVELYKAMHTASPSTQLYAVGYPQFVQKSAVCWNLPSLSAAELEFTVEAVSYTNTMIKHAASEAGIRYIDIEDSLGNQTMCGNSGALTEPLDQIAGSVVTMMKHGAKFDEICNELHISNPLTKLILRHIYESYVFASSISSLPHSPMAGFAAWNQQMIHPNSVGHRLIANKIIGSLRDNTIVTAQCDGRVIYCPSLNQPLPLRPQYFGPKLTDTAVITNAALIAFMTLNKHKGGYIGHIWTTALDTKTSIIFKPAQLLTGGVYLLIHSDARNLGEFTKNSDGSYTIETIIPRDLPLGSHTIEISGVTVDGVKYQHLEPIIVIGPDNDEDTDGIEDSVDHCIYEECQSPITSSTPTTGLHTGGVLNLNRVDSTNTPLKNFSNDTYDSYTIQHQAISDNNGNSFSHSPLKMSQRSLSTDIFNNRIIYVYLIVIATIIIVVIALYKSVVNKKI